MSDKCEYLYIGGMRVPMENVLITYVPWDQHSAITQSFRVVGASPGKDRGEPPYIQTIGELKKLLKHNKNSKMVAHIYDPKLLLHDDLQTGKYVGEPFEFDPSKTLGHAGRDHAAKEGRSAVWSQFAENEFVAGLLAKGVSYGASKGLDTINTGQTDWLARTPAGQVVMNKILESSDPGVNNVKYTLAAAIAKAQRLGVPIPLSKELLESFAKLVPMAEALGFLEKHFVSARVREDAARNPSTPVDSLRILASDANWEVRQYVALNPSTPVDSLRSMASDADGWVRRGVAQNPSTPVDSLRSLASDANWEVRESVAQNPSTPVDSLRSLASDANWEVRESVAFNPSTPVDLLGTLVSDANWRVRRGVGDNPATPIDLLGTLVSDANWRVRKGIAQNPSTPVDPLYKPTRYEDDREHAVAAARERTDAREYDLLQIRIQDEVVRKTINEDLSIKELCSQLQISRSTLDQWRTRGEAPKSFRLSNGKIRFRQSDVEQWLNELSDKPKKR